MNHDLKTFLSWYRAYHRSRKLSVLTICMCGYFHTHEKEAKRMAKHCAEIGYITIKKDDFDITV